jgi:hypothetical protein
MLGQVLSADVAAAIQTLSAPSPGVWHRSDRVSVQLSSI